MNAGSCIVLHRLATSCPPLVIVPRDQCPFLLARSGPVVRGNRSPSTQLKPIEFVFFCLYVNFKFSNMPDYYCFSQFFSRTKIGFQFIICFLVPELTNHYGPRSKISVHNVSRHFFHFSFYVTIFLRLVRPTDSSDFLLRVCLKPQNVLKFISVHNNSIFCIMLTDLS